MAIDNISNESIYQPFNIFNEDKSKKSSLYETEHTEEDLYNLDVQIKNQTSNEYNNTEMTVVFTRVHTCGGGNTCHHCTNGPRCK